VERLGLLLLIATAALGLAIDERPDAVRLADASLTSEAARPAVERGTSALRPLLSETGSTTAAPREAAPTGPHGAAAFQQILGRFAARHTALSHREQERVARAIIDEAHAHGLSPELVMGVIEVESAGYHLAESRVGALGLMQLMPETGREIALKRGIPWKGPDTLFDPVVNVRLGTSYLRMLADRYSGDVDVALAAYNWGPGRIDRFLRRGSNLPSRYVQQVRSAADRYATIQSVRS
jgi:soluble lytic murein transglycosylase